MLNVHQFGAKVIVDEAHGLGIYGNTNNNKNVVKSRVVVYYIYTKCCRVLAAEQVEQHPALACSIHTFGRRRDVTERWLW
jgi:hypothetical protein